MNKLVVIGIVLLLLVGGGLFYRQVFLVGGGKICGSGDGSDVTWDMKAVEGKWEFEPSILQVKKCDRITLNIYNEDEYDHGFAIDVFGVNKRLTPRVTTTITFTATQTGEHVYYCSVPCGEGHFRQKGKIVVSE